MKSWIPILADTGGPRYLELAEAIRADIERGILAPGDRLPPQRAVAKDIGLDVSTVSRGYSEAVRRGYLRSHVGRGTFVAPLVKEAPRLDPARARAEDPRMNMPPEPEDPELVARMQAGFDYVSRNLLSLLRYQSVSGNERDRQIASNWMHANGFAVDLERLVIAPGSHASIHSILTLLARPGDTVLCEAVTYPGIRAITRSLHLGLAGVAMDAQGILPDALERAIAEHAPAALYLNPTLQNPTTLTMPRARREEVAKVLRRAGVPLIEDDAYGFVAPAAPAPISDALPGLGWHVLGVSKCFGAGLRLALTRVPEGPWIGPLTQALRSTNVMASPLTLALFCRWIEDGTAPAVQRFIRTAAAARQHAAARILRGFGYASAETAFNIWLSLPEGTSRAALMGRMPNCTIGLMPSDAFTVAGPPAEALRVCLGGAITQAQLEADLQALRDAVQRADWLG
jgi:DNA-binding transcriptional MocR family regulator